MKSKDEFVTKFADQMAGFLLHAFTQEASTRGDMAEKGRFLSHQLERVRPLLRQMYEFISEEVPAVEERGIEAQTEALLKTWARVPKELQEKVVARCRAAFTPAKVNGAK